MHCPHCRDRQLKRMRVRESGIELDKCDVCRGLWFDQAELEAAMPLAAKDLCPPGDATETHRICPQCRTTLYEFTYPQTLVHIEMCKRCYGLWLDASEFSEIHRVRQHLESQGSLETHAPVTGIKGKLIGFIDRTIQSLSTFD